jgi:hypothetical protein
MGYPGFALRYNRSEGNTMPLVNRGIVFALVAACGASHAQWTATELDGFAARGIDGTSVVGESVSPYQALLWQLPNAPVPLHPAGATRSYAYDTDSGFQVGEVVWGALPHAALWAGDAKSYVDLHPTGAVRSVANAIHDGVQGGFAVFDGVQRAGIWNGTAASWQDLHPAGAVSSLVEDVFDGRQVGVTRLDGIYRASLWSGTAGSWLSLHPVNASESIAYGIDTSSQVGFATFDSDHAALWSGSAASFIDLHPAGASASIAYSVWGASQAGFAIVEGNDHAGYWVSGASGFTDLHQFLDPRLTESWAYDIWKEPSSGVTYVTGRASDGSDSVAVLWRREPDEIAPHTFIRRTGIVASGDVASVAASDDTRLEVLPGIVFTTAAPPVLLEFVGQATAPRATHLSIFIESAATTPSASVTVSALDYDSDQFIVLHNGPSSVIDEVFRFDREDADRFISETGEMRVRLGYRLSGPVFSYPWRTRVDWVRWRVMP